MFLSYLHFVIVRKLLPSETRIVLSTNSTTKSYLRNSIKKGSVRQVYIAFPVHRAIYNI